MITVAIIITQDGDKLTVKTFANNNPASLALERELRQYADGLARITAANMPRKD